MSNKPDPLYRGASASYRPKGYGVSPSLQRARKPFRLSNALIGGTIALFAAGVYTYSISSVKQDDFSDVADLLPPEAERGNVRTLEDEARDALAAKGVRSQRSPEGAAKTAAFQSVASAMPSRPSGVYQPSSPSTLSKPLPDAAGGAMVDAEAGLTGLENSARDAAHAAGAKAQSAAARVKGAAEDAEQKAEGIFSRLVGAFKGASAPAAGVGSTPGPRDAGPGAGLADAELGLTGLERDVNVAGERAARQVQDGVDTLKHKGDQAASAVGSALDSLRHKGNEAASEARSAFDSAKSRAEDAASDIRSRASTAAADAKDTLQDLEHRAERGIERFGNRAEHELQRLGNQAQDGLQRAESATRDGLNRADRAARDGLNRAEYGLERAGKKVQSGWEQFEAKAEDTARHVKHEASKAGDVPVQQYYYLPGRLSELAFAKNRGLVDNRGNLFVWGAPNVDKVGTVSDRENLYGKRLV